MSTVGGFFFRIDCILQFESLQKGNAVFYAIYLWQLLDN